jgi:hypothetical protein
MISHKSRCIFVHQRKAAGTTVKALFDDVEGADRGRFGGGLLDPDWDDARDPVASYFKFTVVRNPWDRFVSAWRYCKSTKHRPIKDVLRNLPQPNPLVTVIAPGASLAARVHSGREVSRRLRGQVQRGLRVLTGRELGKPLQDMGHDYRHITRQQHELVVRSDGSIAVDRVVFFEDLEAGLAEVFVRIGRPMAALPRHKVLRPGDNYRSHFDAEARALFERAYAKDIAVWGYDFESGRSRLAGTAPVFGGEPTPAQKPQSA